MFVTVLVRPQVNSSSSSSSATEAGRRITTMALVQSIRYSSSSSHGRQRDPTPSTTYRIRGDRHRGVSLVPTRGLQGAMGPWVLGQGPSREPLLLAEISGRGKAGGP